MVCVNQLCKYEASGSSGKGARGTGALLSIPGYPVLTDTHEMVVGNVFLYSSDTVALETGIGYGADPYCGWNPYWTPYGAKNNGGVEQNDCGYHLGNYTDWQVQAYVNNGTGFSFFNSQYGTPIWAYNWGSYNITGQNLTMEEVNGWGTHQPTFSGTFLFNGEQWYDGSSWHYWGYTNVTPDCPYNAFWESNTEWYGTSAGC